MIWSVPPVDNGTLCVIPDQVRPIAEAFCKTVLKSPCPKLPCALVRVSSQTDGIIKAQTNGRIADYKGPIWKPNTDPAELVECTMSPALELFMQGPPYPSLLMYGYPPVLKELFADVLTRSFRSAESVWTLSLDGESISYYPWSGNTSILSLFDMTRGYDRHLYDVISPAYLPRDQHFLLNISRVSFEAALAPKKQIPSYVTSPILWISSNCHAPSNRTGYMKEFMSLTPVDAWGSCEKNKGPNLPPEIAKIQRSGATENHYKGNWVGAKKEMMKYYHFTVAFENSFDNDYVTEKLWQPLAAGSVPLYYGPPNVEEWLPCSNCIIDLRRFSSIREAVDYVKTIASNATRYAEFHRWREQPVLPKFQRILDYFQRAEAYNLESMTCAMAHSTNPKLTRFNILEEIGPVFNAYK